MTPKQQRFADEYLIDMNATKAAVRAGYSERSAYAQGQRLLNNDDICEYLNKARGEQQERTQITADQVLMGLYQEATATGDGTSHSARVSAWSQLGKFIGMAERQEHTGKDGAPLYPPKIEIVNAGGTD